MPHRTQGLNNVTNLKVAGGSPSKVAVKGKGTPTQKGKKKKNRKNVESLFAFDTVKEQYNWGRPKRRIKQVSRFDPTTKEIESNCKIGHGFLCPQCSAVNTYDSRQCWQCHLECCYEAGVGVVVLQDRRISYGPPSPEKKKAKVQKKSVPANSNNHKTGRRKKENSSAGNDGERSNKSNNISRTTNNDLAIDHDIQAESFRNRRMTRSKKNMFTDLKGKLKNATKSSTEPQQGEPTDLKGKPKDSVKSNSDSQQSEHDAGIAARVKEATLEWTETTIAASKNGAYSTASNTPLVSEDSTHSSESAAKIPEPPSLEDDIKCCQELKQQLLALQLSYDSMFPNAISAGEEFRDTISKLEAAILQRNKDAAAFGKSLASANSRIEEIKKKVGLLAAQRDEFVKKVESRGWSSKPKDAQNYSTRIDSLSTKMSQMRTECDDAKDRVKDLMSGNEVAKQEKERASKDLEEMETKHGETFAQCYKEIESFKRQLSDATAKISKMATEKAKLVEKVTSTLIYVSKVRSSAESQTAKISALEVSVASLTAQRDAAQEDSRKEVTRLSAEKEEADAKAKNLEDTIKELQWQIESLKAEANATGQVC